MNINRRVPWRCGLTQNPDPGPAKQRISRFGRNDSPVNPHVGTLCKLLHPKTTACEVSVQVSKKETTVPLQLKARSTKYPRILSPGLPAISHPTSLRIT